jgi:DNA-binding HxlR family transcriptional regulator
MTTYTLESVALGDTNVATAQKVIAAALKANEEGAPGRIYDALRAFVSLVLVERRGSGDDLHAWAELVRRTRTALLRSKAREGEWLRPLSDMVGDAIGFAESYRLEEVVGRAHVREILCTLRDTEHARGTKVISRTDLQRRTKLKDANLSRVLGTLIHHGLMERRKDGKHAGYELTARGHALLKRLPPSPSERRRQPGLDLGDAPASRMIPRRPRSAPETRQDGRHGSDGTRPDFGLEVRTATPEVFVTRAAPKPKRLSRTRKPRVRQWPPKHKASVRAASHGIGA